MIEISNLDRDAALVIQREASTAGLADTGFVVLMPGASVRMAPADVATMRHAPVEKGRSLRYADVKEAKG